MPRNKNFKTQSCVLHMCGTFHVRFFELSLGSCGAPCKIPNVKIFKWHTPTVFIQSESNFMINKAVMKEYKVLNVLAIYQNLKFGETLNF